MPSMRPSGTGSPTAKIPIIFSARWSALTLTHRWSGISSRSSARKPGSKYWSRPARLPDYIIACVGGGSNAMGIFHPFLEDKEVKLSGWRRRARAGDRQACRRPGGRQDRRAARLQVLYSPGRVRADSGGLQHLGRTGLSGRRSRAQLSQRDRDGPVTSPSRMRKPWRVSNSSPAPRELFRPWNPPTPSAYAAKMAGSLDKDQIMIINLSGRGDKDLQIVMNALGVKLMSRIAAVFRKPGHKALIPYITVGYPDLESYLESSAPSG